MERIQNTSLIHPQKFRIGELSRPNSPYSFEEGVAFVASSSGVPLKAGYPVLYNETNNAFGYAGGSAADLLKMCGIVWARKDTTKDTYADNDRITILTLGHIVVLNSNSAVEYGTRLTFDDSDKVWEAMSFQSADSAANAGKRADQLNALSVRASDVGGGAASSLIEVRIGY